MAVTERLTFDGDVGFNMVHQSVRGVDGTPRETRRWEYREIEGVLVPSLVYLSRATADGEHVSFSRHLTLRDCTVNESLSQDQFTHRALGLQNGERLLDRIAGVLYQFQDGELVAVRASEKEADSPFALRPYLVIGSVLGALFLVLLALRRRRRAQGKVP